MAKRSPDQWPTPLVSGPTPSLAEPRMQEIKLKSYKCSLKDNSTQIIEAADSDAARQIYLGVLGIIKTENQITTAPAD